LQLEPSDAETWFDLATTLNEGGYSYEAMQAFARVVDLMPEWADGYYAMAKVLVVVGELEAAGIYLQQAAQLDPSKRALVVAEFGPLTDAEGLVFLQASLDASPLFGENDAV
jgi:Flp pilus assembly protein TadD